jgi:hypothetical protein
MQPDIARIIKVSDTKVREHECILKIHIADINEDTSDSDLGEIVFYQYHWFNFNQIDSSDDYSDIVDDDDSDEEMN